MRYAVLLRAVNVGGTGRLAMEDLRRLCTGAGFREVRTCIASGNVVLSSDLDEAAIRAALEPRLVARMGARLPVFVRSAAEMAAVLAASPFAGEDPKHVYAVFLQDPPAGDVLAQARHRSDERLALGAREIYVHYPAGMGRSKLVLPAAREGTARNMNTVAQLAAMAAGGT